jgi:hypothetical protein
MPYLIEAVRTVTDPAIPWVWKCSECETAFDFGTILHESPTRDQIAHINAAFQAHCKTEHRNVLPVVLLNLPT